MIRHRFALCALLVACTPSSSNVDGGSQDAAPSDATNDNNDATSDAGGGETSTGGGPFLFVPSQLNTSRIYSYAIGASGTVSVVLQGGNLYATTTSEDPIALAASPDGKFLFVASQGNAHVGVWSVDKGAGTITKTSFQDLVVSGAYFQDIAADPKGRVVYLTDSSGQNLYTISVDAQTGALGQPQPLALSFAPYALAVDPNAGFLWISGISGTVARVPLDSGGLPVGASLSKQKIATQCLGIASGQFAEAYVACTGPENLYALSSNGGAIVVVDKWPNTSAGVADGGANFTTPSSVAVSANGKFAVVANSIDSALYAFALDSDAGGPRLVSAPTATAPFESSALAIDPSGAHLYEAYSFATNPGSVNVFAIDSQTGVLTMVADGGVAGGTPGHRAVIVP